MNLNKKDKAALSREPEQRSYANFYRAVKVYLVAIFSAFIFVAIVLLLVGFNPLEGISTLLSSSFKTSFGFWETVSKFIPLLLTTYAFAIPFRLKIYNIGSLGQMQVGAIAAVIVAFELDFLPSAFLIPMALLGALVGAGSFAAACGCLKNRYGINPIISTTMLNFVGTYLVLFITTASGYEDPFSGHPMTELIPGPAMIPKIGSCSISLFIAIIIMVGIYVMMKKTVLGYQIEAAGYNHEAAAVYGINVSRFIWLTLGMGGALAGLGGAIQVMAVQGRLIEGFVITSGAEFGIFGILTALVSNGEPVGIPAAAFFMSVLLVGADSMQRTLQIPVELVFLMQVVMVIIIVIIRGKMEKR